MSDGSSDDASGQVVARLLGDWPGGYRYVWNRPALDLPGNMNRATSLAGGQWVLQLHDDDLLRPGAGRVVLDAVGRAGPGERVLLFGVDIVALDETVRRSQTFRRERYLPPGGGDEAGAAQLLLRAPAGGGRPSGCLRGGGPVRGHPRAGLRHRHVDAAVLPLWRALRAPHHLRVHGARGGDHDRHVEPGDRPGLPARSSTAPSPAGSRPSASIRRWETDFFHQFILGGAYRRLRLRQRAEARGVLRLFDLPEIRHLGVSPKWLPVRAAFVAATAGTRRRA